MTVEDWCGGKGVCWVPLLGLLTPWSDPEPPSWRDCLCWSDSRLLLKRPFLVSPLSQTGLLLLLLTDWLLKREGVLLARLLTIEPGGTAPGLLTQCGSSSEAGTMRRLSAPSNEVSRRPLADVLGL